MNECVENARLFSIMGGALSLAHAMTGYLECGITCRLDGCCLHEGHSVCGRRSSHE